MAKENPGMPTDVAKVIWETHANIIKDRWVTALEEALEHKDWLEVIIIIDDMKAWNFDFNRGNK